MSFNNLAADKEHDQAPCSIVCHQQQPECWWEMHSAVLQVIPEDPARTRDRQQGRYTR